MKLGQMLNEQFQKDFIDFYELKLPAKVAYSLKKIKDKIIQESKEFNEIREETLKKYAVYEDGKPRVDENGGVVFLSDEDKQKFIKEIEECLNEEVDHFKIPLSSLLDSGVAIEAKYFEALDSVIDHEK